MADFTVDALIRLGVDRTTAQQTVATMKEVRDSFTTIDKNAQTANKSLQAVEGEMRKLKEVGATLAAAGASILAPLIAAANDYVSRYKGLESAANAFTAAQQRQRNATDALGRVAATALVPAMNQLASITEKIAAFAAAHPDFIQGAVNVGTMLTVGGAALVIGGQIVSTVAKATQLLNSGGLIAGLGQAAVAVGALAAGAKLAEVGLNKLGEATGNEYLAHFQLADALKTAREIIVLALASLAGGFATLRKIFGDAGDQVSLFLSLLKKGVETVADALATIVRGIAFTIQDIFGKLWNSITELLAGIAIKLGRGDIAGALRSTQDVNAMNDTNLKTGQVIPSYYQQQAAQQGSFGPGSDYAQRQEQRNRDYQQAQQDVLINAAQRAIQYLIDQSGIRDFIKGSVNFVNTGALGPGVDNVIKSVTDAIKGFFGGGTAGAAGGAGAKVGISPEAVNAYINYQKAIVDADRTYGEERVNLAISFAQGEAKAARDHADELVKIRLEEQQQEQDAARKFAEDSAKALGDFNFNESQIQAKAQFDRLQKARQNAFELNDLAASRDVAGFVSAEKRQAFETQQQLAQDQFDAQQRKQSFQHEQADRAVQYKQEIADMQLQGKRKIDEANLQFKNEERDRRQAYQDQLAALDYKHQQELTALERQFATELANLDDHNSVLGKIRDAYYATETQAATDFVNRNSAILAQLYSQSIGAPAPQISSNGSSGGGGSVVISNSGTGPGFGPGTFGSQSLSLPRTAQRLAGATNHTIVQPIINLSVGEHVSYHDLDNVYGTLGTAFQMARGGA